MTAKIRFAENESKHAQRCRDTYRRTILLRRALLARFTGREYPAIPIWISELSTDDLMDRLGVRLAGSNLVPIPGWKPLSDLVAYAGYRKAVYSKVEGGAGKRTESRLGRGLPISYPLHGYREQNEIVEVLPEFADLIRDAFQIACELGYLEAGNYLTGCDFLTASGSLWNKDTARTYLRNPFHAGYCQSFGGTGNKRGLCRIYPMAAMAKPPVCLEDWIDANLTYAQTNLVEFPDGYRSPADQDAWDRRFEMLDGFVSIQDAATLVGKTVSTVQQWIRAGKIDTTRLGGRLYLLKSDLPI